MKAWRLERLGGKFSFTETPKPEVRPGSVLVRVEAVSLVSYLKAYVEGRLPHYRAPDGTFTPGGNCVGTIEAVGRDVWHLKPGQRAIVSSFLVASENVPDPAQMLIGMTAFGGASADMQADWRDGTLAEYVLSPVPAVTPVTGLDALPAEQLVIASRCVVPLGGLMRGRLAAGETLIITGATGAFGAGAILVAIALGAGRIVAAGRNQAALDDIAKRLDNKRIVPVALTGSVERDAAVLRDAADGGAHMALDIVGQAQTPDATLAALSALRRNGRLALMGSMSVPLPISYTQLMASNLEIMGQFMHTREAYIRLLDLVRTGQLDLTRIAPRTFPLASLPEAMVAAEGAGKFELVAVKP